MVQFYKEYGTESLIVKQSVSQLENTNHANLEFMKQTVSQIPWAYNILLMQKVKETYFVSESWRTITNSYYWHPINSTFTMRWPSSFWSRMHVNFRSNSGELTGRSSVITPTVPSS